MATTNGHTDGGHKSSPEEADEKVSAPGPALKFEIDGFEMNHQSPMSFSTTTTTTTTPMM